MTAVKEQLVQMVPRMPMLIPNLTEDNEQQIYNLFITVEPEESKKSSLDDDDIYTIPSVEQRKKALEGLMEFCGSIEPPEDFEADKEEYLRSKYESLT